MYVNFWLSVKYTLPKDEIFSNQKNSLGLKAVNFRKDSRAKKLIFSRLKFCFERI